MRLERGAGAEGFRRGGIERRDVRVDDIVFPVEHDVLGIERIAVGPFRAFDQLHGQLVAVVRPFPALGEVRQRLHVLGFDLEQRRGARQALGHADVDAAPALGLAGAVVPALRPAADDVAHRVAIDADAVGHVAGLEHQRLLGQPLGHRRQLAGLDELFGDPGRLLVFGQRLEFDDQSRGDVGDLALRRERRLRRHFGRLRRDSLRGKRRYCQRAGPRSG